MAIAAEPDVTPANQVYFKAAPTAAISTPGSPHDSVQRSDKSRLWTPGPTIDGIDTKIYTYAPEDLVHSALWRPFVTAVNEAFEKSHIDNSILGSRPRITDALDYLSASKGDSKHGSFTMVCMAEQQVVSTVSARPYTAPDPTKEIHPMMRDVAPALQDGARPSVFWEIKLLAVHPNYQRRGLAGSMMRHVEQEIIRRFGEAREADDELTILLTTIKEINFALYVSKGYVVDYETKKPVGTLTSQRAFTLSHFSKKIPVDT